MVGHSTLPTQSSRSSWTRLAAILGPLQAALFAAVTFLSLQWSRELALIVSIETAVSPAKVSLILGQDVLPATEVDAGPEENEVGPVRFSFPSGAASVGLRLIGTGVLEVRGIELASPWFTLRRWQGAGEQAGWHRTRGNHVLDGGKSWRVRPDAEGVIELRLDDLAPFRARRRVIHLGVGVAVGLVAACLATWVVARGGGSGTRRAGPPRRMAVFFVRAVSLVVSTTLGIVVLRLVLARETAPVEYDDSDYSLTWVDHSGRRVSAHPGRLILMLDPFSFYRNAPSQRTAAFAIDAHGFRGGRSTSVHPLILVTGGSSAFGYGLASDGEVFTSQLASMLASGDVVNAAVVGFLSGQELAEFVHRDLSLEPDVVVSFGGWNDLFVPLFAHGRCREGDLAYGHNWDVFCSFEDRLRALTEGRDVEPAAKAARVPAQAEAIARQALDEYVDNVSTMARIAEAHGARFVAVFQPHLASKRVAVGQEVVWRDKAAKSGVAQQHRRYEPFLDGAAKALGARKVNVLDLNAAPAFRENEGALFLDGAHLNSVGHRLVAESMCREVLTPMQIECPDEGDAAPRATSPRSGPPGRDPAVTRP